MWLFTIILFLVIPFILIGVVGVKIFLKASGVFDNVRTKVTDSTTIDELKELASVEPKKESVLSKLSKPKKLKGLDD